MNKTAKKPAKRVKKKAAAPPAPTSEPESLKNGASEGSRRLTLSDFEGVRKTMGRLTRDYDGGRLSEQKYRAFVYGLRGLLTAIELEEKMKLTEEFNERLDAMETKLAQIQRDRRTGRI